MWICSGEKFADLVILTDFKGLHNSSILSDNGQMTDRKKDMHKNVSFLKLLTAF